MTTSDTRGALVPPLCEADDNFPGISWISSGRTASEIVATPLVYGFDTGFVAWAPTAIEVKFQSEAFETRGVSVFRCPPPGSGIGLNCRQAWSVNGRLGRFLEYQFARTRPGTPD